MKRTISLLLTLMMAFTFIPNVYASYLVDEGVCGMNGDNVKWTLDSDGILTISGTGEITGWPGPGGNDVTILYIDIQPGITKIGEKSFYFRSDAVKVSIPESVTSIGELAFDRCLSLTNIVLPESVKDIGEAGFQYCQSLSRIELPSSLEKIGKYCFYGSMLTDVYYTGTKEQWDKIDVDYVNNEELKNATIHFNSHMPTNTRIAVSTVKKLSQYTYGYRGKVTIENLKSEAILIAIFYRNDDVLYEGTKTIDPGERVDETFGYTPPTNLWPIPLDLKPTSCKLFLWNNLDDIQPLCEAYEVKLR